MFRVDPLSHSSSGSAYTRSSAIGKIVYVLFRKGRRRTTTKRRTKQRTKHQALSLQKTSIANARLRVGMFFSFNCWLWLSPRNALLTKLANSKGRSMYKDSEAFLPSFYRSQLRSISFPLFPLSLPQTPVPTKERQSSKSSRSP